uniref:Astacin domain-containing protein n=1 Tax=Strongyloides venezuelensis TaxID=75913 RepID=A0A0K0FAV7_STRVS
MKQLSFILFFVLLFILRNTIEAKSLKHDKKSLKNQELPAYTKSSPIKFYLQDDNIVNYAQGAIDFIEFSTFLKFSKQSRKINDVGINFYYNNKEDKVELSYDNKKPTIVNLTKNTYNSKHLAKFYVGYALGLIPEIARKDRDSEVKIFSQNILAKYKKFYDKKKGYPESYYATDFDYSSMMMFNSSFGSIEKGKRTFKSEFESFYEKQIGGLGSYSFNDYKRLNILYFKDKCKNAPKCQNKGYYGNNCNECKCVYPFAGKYCKSYAKKIGTCEDSFLNAYSNAKTITFNKYAGECYYIIKAKSKRRKVKLTIVNFKGVGQYKLEVKYRKDKGAAGLLINRDVKNIVFPSLSSSVIVTYHTYNVSSVLTIKYQAK